MTRITIAIMEVMEVMEEFIGVVDIAILPEEAVMFTPTVTIRTITGFQKPIRRTRIRPGIKY